MKLDIHGKSTGFSTALLGLLWFLQVSVSDAATVSWSVSQLTGASDVSTSGTFLEALNFSSETNASSFDTTINGVTFSGLVSGGTSNSFNTPTATYYSSNSTSVLPFSNDNYDSPPGLADFEVLMERWLFGGSSANTVTSNSLTVGQQYELQLFIGATQITDNRYIVINDGLGHSIEGRTTTNFGSDTSPGPEDSAANPADMGINGTFTVDATSQDFTITNSRNGSPP